MRDYRDITRLMERTIHKYNQVEKMKRTYGTDMSLSRAEIHTVAAVGDNMDINVTSLAKYLGITKGAASQMIYKLVDKGLIIKRVSPSSDTEVCLSLTALGQKAYEAHREYHATAKEQMFDRMRNMSQDTQEQLVELLEEFDKALDERLK